MGLTGSEEATYHSVKQKQLETNGAGIATHRRVATCCVSRTRPQNTDIDKDSEKENAYVQVVRTSPLIQSRDWRCPQRPQNQRRRVESSPPRMKERRQIQARVKKQNSLSTPFLRCLFR